MTRSYLFVHIGSPKTGSTSLQATASRSRQDLAATGLLYPEATERGFGHHDIAFLLGGGYPDWARPQTRSLTDLGRELSEECRSHRGDVLLSSENFYLFPAPDALKAFLDQHGITTGREIRIVVFLRQQDQLLLSWYNQSVKALGEARDFDSVLPGIEPLGQYFTRLETWARTFGRDAIIACNYNDASAANGGLWGDFMNALGRGGKVAAVEPPDDTRNISLSRDVLEVQRIINRLPLRIEQKRTFHKDLMELTATGLGAFSDAPLLRNSARRGLLERFAAENSALAKAYFGGHLPFDAADISGPDGPEYPGLSQDTVFSVLAWLILRKNSDGG